MRRIILTLFLFGLFLSISTPNKAVFAAPLLEETPPEVLAILNQMSPEARVGQLFLVTFDGPTADADTDIYRLITRHQIGGVILSSIHNNFDDSESVTEQTIQLTRALQTAAHDANPSAAGDTPSPADGTEEPPYIPLFIGLAHTGDTPQVNQQLFSGVTPLPSAMALGATWDTKQAQAIGEITGYELAALGINLMLGPSLDVLDIPHPDSGGDPGTTSFGGSPFWAGRFGQAYVRGVHTGSDGEVAVILRNFPGLGASERLLSEDTPTINRSFETLLNIELAPYFAVTGRASDPLARTDGLMLVPARYSGLQGSITSTTRPLGFDQAAVNQLLARPELAEWYAGGGILVSESLGLGAVRRYYSSPEIPFPANTVALDAFLAGNDLLYIDQFTAGQDVSQASTLIATIRQFTQKYREDTVFAERVDRAVERILTLKWQLYGEFELRTSLASQVPPDDLGTGTDQALAVAQQAAALIYPTATELSIRVPRPPGSNERVVFLTDSRIVRQCNTCPVHHVPEINALENIVVRLYGASGTQQVRSTNLSSYSFEALDAYLSGVSLTPDESTTPAPDETSEPAVTVGDDLARADWIVVGLQDMGGEQTNAFRRLLAERPDLIRDRQVIVFALNAPYYLDATEVVQLSAYYGLYGTTPPFIETAARILFQEVTPNSSPVVSVLTTGYSLPDRLAPAPNQVIQLFVETTSLETGLTPTPEDTPGVAASQTPSATSSTPTITPTTSEATPTTPPIGTGQSVLIVTRPILDHNGHIVPDGTLVQFSVTYLEQNLVEIVGVRPTVNGIASLDFNPSIEGTQEIRASSGAALESTVIKIEVEEGRPEVIPSPDVLPTETPTPEIPTPTQFPTATLVAETPCDPATDPNCQPAPVDFADLVWAFATILVLSVAGWRISERDTIAANRVKLILAIIIGVMISYNYWVLQGPGADMLNAGSWGAVIFSWAGGLVGLLLGWIWLHRNQPEQ